MDNILIGSMHSKSQKLNNDCYKVVEKPSAVGRAQTGNHKNWILIWVLLLISSVNLDTLSSFFLVCHPVLKMDSQRKETRAISKTFSKCFFMSFHLLSLNNFSWWREVCSSLESPWKWGWNPSRDGLARREMVQVRAAEIESSLLVLPVLIPAMQTITMTCPHRLGANELKLMKGCFSKRKYSALPSISSQVTNTFAELTNLHT